MSLSKYLQSPETIKSIFGRSPDDARSLILDRGMTWLADHPEEAEIIKNNLISLGISFTEGLIVDIQEHIVLHYYEKILPLCGNPEFYYRFLNENVDVSEIDTLKGALEKERGILATVAHFGGVELIVPTLALFKLPIHPVLRFTTEQFSKVAHKHAKDMEESGLFGPINFIEIGRQGTVAAMDMAAVLRRKEVLVSVFDEETEYSIPVNLFGREILGGAGLDRLLRFTNTPVAVFNTFMVRTGINKYRLKFIEVDISAENPIQVMFDNLENSIKEHLEQWYFLHEEIPFVKGKTEK
jgi:lauroyl/myristoyl acyltransferase